MKTVIIKRSLILIVLACLLTTSFGQNINTSSEVKEVFNIPFGTIAKMEVEIIDGNELNRKGFAGRYIVKVYSVDSVKLSTPIIIEFKDETETLPENDFQLYLYSYGREPGRLTSDTISLLQKDYVGKKFTVIAYESGGFYGIPNNYYKYQKIMKSSTSFYFKNYIIVIAKLD